MIKPHEWKPITPDVQQCSRCHIVSVGEYDPVYFHRGERCEPGRDFDVEGCLGDPFPPVSLASIKSFHPHDPPERLLWLILHYNAPLTHITTIMDGLLKLTPIFKPDVLRAHMYNMASGQALLREIFKSEPASEA